MQIKVTHYNASKTKSGHHPGTKYGITAGQYHRHCEEDNACGNAMMALQFSSETSGRCLLGERAVVVSFRGLLHWQKVELNSGKGRDSALCARGLAALEHRVVLLPGPVSVADK